MVAQPSFSENWPERVRLRDDVDWLDAFEWLMERADNTATLGRSIYTTFSKIDYGFKDKSLAMEFKLHFG